jgi:KDO2-lipid IV(A) lauroyltransferase
MPFWMLHVLSFKVYVLIFYVIGYRKKVVIQNLKNSFPEKSEQEIKKITKQFYKHFCDVIFETLKLMTISKSEFKKRFAFTPAAIKMFNGFEKNQQSVIGVMGHCGNWEWGAIAHQFYFKQLITGVYHPLTNKNFDAFMKNLRGRMGGNIVAMNNLLRELVTLRKNNIPTTVGLIADQTPPPEGSYWLKFLNQDTPVFLGPEKLAKKFNYPVVYVGIIKLKRSFYQMEATLITDKPNELADGVITELHTKVLEKNILEQPQFWLWSHRRWKHKKPNNL